MYSAGFPLGFNKRFRRLLPASCLATMGSALAIRPKSSLQPDICLQWIVDVAGFRNAHGRHGRRDFAIARAYSRVAKTAGRLSNNFCAAALVPSHIAWGGNSSSYCGYTRPLFRNELDASRLSMSLDNRVALETSVAAATSDNRLCEQRSEVVVDISWCQSATLLAFNVCMGLQTCNRAVYPASTNSFVARRQDPRKPQLTKPTTRAWSMCTK